MIYVHGSAVSITRFEDWDNIDVRFEDGGETNVNVSYMRADDGINEIAAAIDALPMERQGKWQELK